MRSLRNGLILGVLLLAGCTWDRTGVNGTGRAPVVKNTEPPTVRQLVDYLNGNSSRFDSLEAKMIGLDVKADGQEFSPTGFLACQKDKSFRLQVRALNNPEADIGSNKDGFWFWFKRSDPPYLFHCSYADLNNATNRMNLPIPFQPEWVLEAIGMATYTNPDVYKLEVKADTLEMSEMSTTPQGQQVKKTIILARTPQTPPSPQVLGHVLQEANTGKVICKASIQKVQQKVVTKDGAKTSVIVPTIIVLECPSEKVTMKINLMEFDANVAFTPDRQQTLFSMNSLPHLQKYDLGKGPPAGTPTAIQRTGAVSAAPATRR